MTTIPPIEGRSASSQIYGDEQESAGERKREQAEVVHQRRAGRLSGHGMGFSLVGTVKGPCPDRMAASPHGNFLNAIFTIASTSLMGMTIRPSQQGTEVLRHAMKFNLCGRPWRVRSQQ